MNVMSRVASKGHPFSFWAHSWKGIVNDMQQPAPATFFAASALNIIVFVSGAAVMIYEFIAVRFLQRFFGSSLDVWAGEISVCLLGLAAGYSVGGWLADRFRSWIPLAIVLCIAGGSAIPMEPIVIKSADMLAQGEHMRWWEPLAASAAATSSAASAPPSSRTWTRPRTPASVTPEAPRSRGPRPATSSSSG